MNHLCLSAVVAVTAQFAFDLEWLLLALVLVAMVIGGFVVVLKVKRWHAAGEPKSVDERLREYRELVNQGLLQPDEFERIRVRLQGPSQPTGQSPETPGEKADDHDTRGQDG